MNEQVQETLRYCGEERRKRVRKSDIAQKILNIITSDRDWETIP